MTLLFLYSAEVRYALQLRHLSNKTRSRSVTRKSRVQEPVQKWRHNYRHVIRDPFAELLIF